MNPLRRLEKRLPNEARTWEFFYVYLLFFGLVYAGYEAGIVMGRVELGMTPFDAFTTRLHGHIGAHVAMSALVCCGCWRLTRWAVKKVVTTR